MRVRALLREIARNLASGTSRLGTFFVLAAMSVGLVLMADLLTISHGINEAVDFRESGSAVMILTVPGRINGEACEALSVVPNVVAAGAMRSSGKTAATTLPGEPLELYTTTPTFGRVLGAEDHGDGVYVSSDVASSLGETTVPLEGRSIPVRGVYSYPPDGRRAGFGWAVLSPTNPSDGIFDECWAAAWPQREDLRQLMLTTVTPANGTAAGEQPQVSQLNGKYGQTFAGTADYQSRITQYAPFVAFGMGLMLGFAAVWFRRVEISSNLHAGARRDAMYVQYVAETTAWSLPASAFGWMTGFFFSTVAVPAELTSLAFRSFSISFALLAGATAGATIGFTAVRESRLWRYVKGR